VPGVMDLHIIHREVHDTLEFSKVRVGKGIQGLGTTQRLGS
jgi:hypothetical protein